MQIDSARISQQIFGVATDSAFATTGILGVSLGLDGLDNPYPYVLDNLATQGFTNSRAFALDIRSIESSRGSVVFGGLDTRKFTGRLEKRPTIPPGASPDGYTRYWIYLDGLRVVGANKTAVDVLDQPNGQPVLLESGYTVSTVPKALFAKVFSAFLLRCPVTRTRRLPLRPDGHQCGPQGLYLAAGEWLLRPRRYP